MATEIKYKNALGLQVSAQQANLLIGDYSHELYVDGVLKKIDLFEDGQLDNGEYFLSEGEDIQSALLLTQSEWNSGVYLTKVQQTANYTLFDWILYEKTTKLEEGKRLVDNQGRVIAEQYMDLSTHAIRYTVKYSYLANLGSFVNSGTISNYGTLEFTYGYREPNEIMVEVNLPGFNNETYFITAEDNILNHPIITPLFSWDTQIYYHSDQLIPL
ncbi:hypothetical protein LX99_03040 [Mucilaginibacter oryzae]|uniref:Uncharacterized protein n=1 Tax=Mucilaginibacter oryzae TaxID=468058 RepID=A0A316H7U5_9SPHI|nr:hypothetical protein [Mucilaginibacter oryzae]PWK77229.1 hypothetical protein LX99_03040 [Mucilaginibacter oryzae]